MAGVELSFPRTPYGLPSIHYGNDKEFWGSHPNRTYPFPTQPSTIRDFFIALNRSTFQPVHSRGEMLSYTRLRLYGDENLPPEWDRWLEPFFSPELYREGSGKLQHIYDEQIAFSTPLIGPILPLQDEFGLRRVASKREGIESFKTTGREVYDTWYFDDLLAHTLISCMHASTNRTANKISCVHYFVVPELNAIAYERYMVMADVSDWSHIETEIRKRILSYVVYNPRGGA
jgi:hypothetical protein